MRSGRQAFLTAKWAVVVIGIVCTLAACQRSPVSELSSTPSPQADVLTATVAPTASITDMPPLSPTSANSDEVVEQSVLPLPYIGPLPEEAVARLGQGEIQMIKTSPDTKYLGIGTSTGVLVYDAATQEVLWSIPTPHSVSVITWSHDSSAFAAGLHDGTIIAWSLQTGREQFSLSSDDGYVTMLDWTPDDNYLISSASKGVATISDGRTGTRLHRLVYVEESYISAYGDPITYMFGALSPDGKKYVTHYEFGGTGGPRMPGTVFVIWDVATGTQQRVVDTESGILSGVEWSPDSRYLASETTYLGVIEVWDAFTGQSAAQIEAGIASEVVWSPDGTKIFARSYYGNSSVVDVIAQKVLFDITYDGDEYSEYFFNWSSDSTQISVHDGRGKVTTYDTHTGEVLNQIDNMMVSQASTPDGSGYYIVDYQGSGQLLKLWDVKSGAFTKTLLVGSDFSSSLSWSPDGQNLALATGYYCEPNQTMVWNVTSGKLTVALDTRSECPSMTVAWSPDGKTLAVGYNGSISLIDTVVWTEIGEFAASDIPVFAWSPDSKRIAIGGDHVWDVAAHHMLFPIIGEYTNPVYSSNGKVLVTNGVTDSGAGELIIWDGNTGERLHTLSDEWPYITSMAINEDVTLLGTVDGYYSQDSCGKVKIWNLKSAQVHNTISSSNLPEAGCPSSIAMSPDGKSLAVAFVGSTSGIALFDMQTSRILRTLRGHAGYIYGLAFSPDGKLLASASSDGTIILWNMGD